MKLELYNNFIYKYRIFLKYWALIHHVGLLRGRWLPLDPYTIQDHCRCGYASGGQKHDLKFDKSMKNLIQSSQQLII